MYPPNEGRVKEGEGVLGKKRARTLDRWSSAI